MALDYLVDTNVLLRALAIANPQNAVARQAIEILLADGADLCIAPQNMIEFWAVCTRSEKENGLGKSISTTARYCRFMESFLTVLPETEDVLPKWRSLVMDYRVSGKKVHDAKIVAVMDVRGVRRILTFNTDDFSRYEGLEVVHPRQIRRPSED